MSFLSGVSSVFSKLGKSEAFTGALAAIGTVGAGAIVTKISGVPSPAQQAYAAQQAAAAAPVTSAVVSAAYQVPWGLVLLIGAVGVVGYALMKGRKGARGS